jgi:hypothetical protein
MGNTTSARRVTEVIEGYKIVSSSYTPFVHPEEVEPYVVGTTVSVEDCPDDVRLCERGLHFCLHALDCLAYYTLEGGNRLIRVAVPVGATVVTDSDGRKYAASALTVLEDATHDRDRLLTGLRIGKDEVVWYQSGRQHRTINDEPASVRRDARLVRKSWKIDGEAANVCLGKYCGLTRFCDSADTLWVTTAPDSTATTRQVVDRAEAAKLTEILCRREAFEPTTTQ